MATTKQRRSATGRLKCAKRVPLTNSSLRSLPSRTSSLWLLFDDEHEISFLLFRVTLSSSRLPIGDIIIRKGIANWTARRHAWSNGVSDSGTTMVVTPIVTHSVDKAFQANRCSSTTVDGDGVIIY